jgi:Outer membrane protein beta-barrel domain
MRRTASVARVLWAGGVLLAAAAHPLVAQRISITPNIGVYVPTTELIKAANGEEFKQEMSFTVGGRLGVMFSDRLGLEFTGAYAPSDLKVTASGFADQTEDANVFTGSGRLSFHVIPSSSPLSLMVTGGVGLINRSGDFYATAENKTDIGATLGATVGFRVGSLLRIQVSAEDYIYKPKAEIPGFGPGDEKQTQNDIHLSFGVGIPLLGLGTLGQ